MATTVLGSYPNYINLSNQLGSRRFDIEPSVWSVLSQQNQWVANRYFLDTILAARDKLIFSSNPRLARPGSWFFRELHYLRTKGVNVFPPQHMWGAH